MNTTAQVQQQVLFGQAQHGLMNILIMIVVGFIVYSAVMMAYSKHLKVSKPEIKKGAQVAKAKLAGLILMAVVWFIMYKIMF